MMIKISIYSDHFFIKFLFLFYLNLDIIDEMALYRFFTGTAVSAKTQKHDVFLKPTVPGKKSN